jgi:hypothetical protein
MLSEKDLETIEQKSRLIDGFDMGIRTPTNEYRLDIKNLLQDLKTYKWAFEKACENNPTGTSLIMSNLLQQALNE